jgi:hypothetical protein
MRKLVVVMLTVGSLLLLEAPAWAPHLYRLSSTSGGKSGGKRWFSGETDCTDTVKVNFTDGRVGTAPKGAVNSTTKQRTIRVSTTDTGSNRRPNIEAAYCGGVLMTLPMTGVSALHKLAFAALLLVAGVVLIILGRSPTRTGPGRRQAGAGPG